MPGQIRDLGTDGAAATASCKRGEALNDGLGSARFEQRAAQLIEEGCPLGGGEAFACGKGLGDVLGGVKVVQNQTSALGRDAGLIERRGDAIPDPGGAVGDEQHEARVADAEQAQGADEQLHRLGRIAERHLVEDGLAALALCIFAQHVDGQHARLAPVQLEGPSPVVAGANARPALRRARARSATVERDAHHLARERGALGQGLLASGPEALLAKLQPLAAELHGRTHHALRVQRQPRSLQLLASLAVGAAEHDRAAYLAACRRAERVLEPQMPEQWVEPRPACRSLGAPATPPPSKLRTHVGAAHPHLQPASQPHPCRAPAADAHLLRSALCEQLSRRLDALRP